MLPNELDNKREEEEKDDNDSLEAGKDVNWEMRSIKSPTSPQVPFTPRTMAFRTLDSRPSQQARFA